MEILVTIHTRARARDQQWDRDREKDGEEKREAGEKAVYEIYRMVIENNHCDITFLFEFYSRY